MNNDQKTYLAVSVAIAVIAVVSFAGYRSAVPAGAQWTSPTDSPTYTPTDTPTDTPTSTASPTQTPTDTTTPTPTNTTTSAPRPTIIITRPPTPTYTSTWTPTPTPDPTGKNRLMIDTQDYCQMRERLVTDAYVLLDDLPIIGKNKVPSALIPAKIQLADGNKLSQKCAITVTADVPKEIRVPNAKYSTTCVGDAFCGLDIPLDPDPSDPRTGGALDMTTKFKVTIDAKASPECNTVSSHVTDWLIPVELAAGKHDIIFQFGGVGNGQYPAEYSQNFIRKIVGKEFTFRSWRSEVKMDGPMAEIVKYAKTNLYETAANDLKLQFVGPKKTESCVAYPRIMIAGFSLGGARTMTAARTLARDYKLRTNAAFILDAVPASINGSAISDHKFLHQGDCVYRDIAFFQHEDTSGAGGIFPWSKRGREIMGGTKNVGVTAQLTPDKAAAGVVQWSTAPDIALVPRLKGVPQPFGPKIFEDNFHELMLSDKAAATAYAEEIKKIIGGVDKDNSCSGKVPESLIEDRGIFGGVPGGNLFGGVEWYVWDPK